MCNRQIKFGVFWKFAIERGQILLLLDFSKKSKQIDGSFDLLIGRDENTDQIYSRMINQDDFTHSLFQLVI
jgi:tRNA U34 2-thiouridine synthase MnmA/TrmU